MALREKDITVTLYGLGSDSGPISVAGVNDKGQTTYAIPEPSSALGVSDVQLVEDAYGVAVQGVIAGKQRVRITCSGQEALGAGEVQCVEAVEVYGVTSSFATFTTKLTPLATFTKGSVAITPHPRSFSSRSTSAASSTHPTLIGPLIAFAVWLVV